jgi:hypothetical protein
MKIPHVIYATNSHTKVTLRPRTAKLFSGFLAWLDYVQIQFVPPRALSKCPLKRNSWLVFGHQHEGLQVAVEIPESVGNAGSGSAFDPYQRPVLCQPVNRRYSKLVFQLSNTPFVLGYKVSWQVQTVHFVIAVENKLG